MIFRITVDRTSVRKHEFEIKADDVDQASARALDAANDFDYANVPETAADYEITSIIETSIDAYMSTLPAYVQKYIKKLEGEVNRLTRESIQRREQETSGGQGEHEEIMREIGH